MSLSRTTAAWSASALARTAHAQLSSGAIGAYKALIKPPTGRDKLSSAAFCRSTDNEGIGIIARCFWRRMMSSFLLGSCLLVAIINLSATEVLASDLPPCPLSGQFHNCFGTFIYNEAYGYPKYIGEWREGSRHGFGTHFYRGESLIDKGIKYSGEWRDDARHGQGIMEWHNWKYTGEWKDDKRSGQGIQTHSAGHPLAGSTYIGEWMNDKMHGHGTLSYGSDAPFGGGEYSGEWEDGERHGQGTQIYDNGDRYVGEWLHDKRNGRGTIIYADGSQKQGTWKEDEFLSVEASSSPPRESATLNPTDGQKEGITSPSTSALAPAAPVDDSVRTTAPAPSVDIAEVQSLLAQLGYEPGIADGLMGPRTGRAIQQFQRDRGIKPDGQPSQTLVNELRDSQSQIDASIDTDEYATYTRHSHGWSVRYPAEWQVDATNPRYVEFSQPEVDALCGVHSDNTRWTSINEVLEFVLTQDGSQTKPGGPKNYTIEHKRVTAPPAVDGIRAIAVLVPGGTSLRGYFINSGKLIIVDCEAFTSNWKQVSSTYRNILDTISFEISPAAIAYEEGVAAWQSGTESKAFEHFHRAAEGGDARAQYSVGIMLDQGRGTDTDPGEAITWLRRAAEQGILEAQVAFWQIKARAGVLMKADRDEVYKWQRLAAENGHTGSQFELGMRTLYGRGATENKTEEALVWFLKAARQGHPRAQHEAGAILLDGSLALNDNAAAYGWLSLAVENGNQAAAGLKEKALSFLSSKERLATDNNVKMCLDTNYRECNF